MYKDLNKKLNYERNHNFCFKLDICDIFSQNCVLELFNNPSTIRVLSPSIDKYLGSSALVLFHVNSKSDEFGFLKFEPVN